MEESTKVTQQPKKKQAPAPAPAKAEAKPPLTRGQAIAHRLIERARLNG